MILGPKSPSGYSTYSLLLILQQYLSITIDSAVDLIGKFMACEDNVCNLPTYYKTGLDS
jgi:hypothetical protein